MTDIEVTRREVDGFISGPAAALTFPDEAAHDAAAAAAFVARMRKPYPADYAERVPVAVLDEVDISPDVRVRVYVPDALSPRPMLVYYHGGGWVLGDLNQHDLTCRMLAVQASVIVVNVAYRLAPEHPYPAAFDDAWDALVWAYENAETYGGDPTKLAVAGSSAGGNLAAAVALKSRETRGPQVGLQVLICPVLDSERASDSYREFATGNFLTAIQMEWFWQQYAPDANPADPYLSPSHANSLAGLPPAIIVVAGRDPLHDEGVAYAHRLRAEGGHAELIDVEGQIHGFLGMIDVFTDARIVLGDIASRIPVVAAW